MKRILAILLLLPLVLPLGCSKKKEANPEDAKQVVIDFFQWHNEKNLNKMESLLQERRKGISWELDKLESVKLLKIEEDTSPVMKDSFMNSGAGSVIHPYEVKVFRTEFKIKYRGGSGSGLSNGTHRWSYWLIKEKKDSPWLIADWGY